MKECTICNELKSASKNNRLYSSSKIKSAFLVKSAHFTIIPSIGALTLGHSLLVTNKHQNSIFKYADYNSFEINNLLEIFWNKLKPNKNQTLLCFEHGSNKDGEFIELCSTTHAHLHILPISIKHVLKIYEALKTNNYLSCPNNISDIEKSTKLYEDYLLSFTYDGNQLSNIFIRNAKFIESQYMRKIIGNIIGNPNWNWKENIDNTLTIKTIDAFEFQINTL